MFSFRKKGFENRNLSAFHLHKLKAKMTKNTHIYLLFLLDGDF